MKFKTTKKAIKQHYNKILKINYCKGQYLLKYYEPMAYSTRAEGWACDYYDIDGVLISTGYAPIESEGFKNDYELLQEYENKAREIACNNECWDNKRIAVSKLLHELIEKLRI